jgi:hypothetical protein
MGASCATPTASAISVTLLKIIMRRKLGVQPDDIWFEQEAEDPFAAGCRHSSSWRSRWRS